MDCIGHKANAVFSNLCEGNMRVVKLKYKEVNYE